MQRHSRWELAIYNPPEALDHSDRMRLRGLLARAEQMNLVTDSNYDLIVKLARPLGFGPLDEKDLAPFRDGRGILRPAVGASGFPERTFNASLIQNWTELSGDIEQYRPSTHLALTSVQASRSYYDVVFWKPSC